MPCYIEGSDRTGAPPTAADAPTECKPEEGWVLEEAKDGTVVKVDTVCAHIAIKAGEYYDDEFSFPGCVPKTACASEAKEGQIPGTIDPLAKYVVTDCQDKVKATKAEEAEEAGTKLFAGAATALAVAIANM